MWEPETRITKLSILAAVIALTLGIHYGWIVEPIFGHVHWVHAIHGRFCYIPIVIAAAWFGLRGGIYAALIISALVLPYIIGSGLEAHTLADEITEIVFYFAIAILSGALLDRELRARQRAEDARIQLERSQKLSLVGQIAAGMAHEIKNPLASIKGAVEILGDESASSQDQEEFRTIVFKEIKRINRSVTEFLEFARPSDARFTAINLADVARGSIRQVAVQAHKQGITVASEIADPVSISGDGEKIHQVLLNLLLNAVEVSSDGSTVQVQLERDEESSQAVINIADQGPGLSAEEQAHIFEPFFSTKSSGTGLGLAIAKSIIDSHQGTIALTNGVRGGALATITFPLVNEKGVDS